MTLASTGPPAISCTVGEAAVASRCTLCRRTIRVGEPVTCRRVHVTHPYQLIWHARCASTLADALAVHARDAT
jgi:hypothetical protein